MFSRNLFAKQSAKNICETIGEEIAKQSAKNRHPSFFANALRREGGSFPAQAQGEMGLPASLWIPVCALAGERLFARFLYSQSLLSFYESACPLSFGTADSKNKEIQ